VPRSACRAARCHRKSTIDPPYRLLHTQPRALQMTIRNVSLHVATGQWPHYLYVEGFLFRSFTWRPRSSARLDTRQPKCRDRGSIHSIDRILARPPRAIVERAIRHRAARWRRPTPAGGAPRWRTFRRAVAAPIGVRPAGPDRNALGRASISFPLILQEGTP
jgi:hypothetical protein